MKDSKELYKTLSADFKTERNYYFSDLGEGMMQGHERDSRRRYLINKSEEEAWELVGPTGCFEHWNAVAVEIANNITEKPYVCLNPNYTIPISENTNLETQRELLRKLVYGMMLLYGAMAIKPDNDPEYEGKIGILTAINPDEDENLQFMLLGLPVESQDDTYEIHGITSLVKKGEAPKGCRTPFGTMTATEICDAMNLEGNIDIFLNDFIESAKMIYSGNLPLIN